MIKRTRKGWTIIDQEGHITGHYKTQLEAKLAERDPHLTPKAKHHGYWGLLLMAGGFIALLSISTQAGLYISEIVMAIGLWLVLDDWYQHAKQHGTPYYRSPINKLWSKILALYRTNR